MPTDLYSTVHDWCERQLGPSRPLFVGVNGPQGGGKSTLTRRLCERFESEGKRAVTVSIDDFYLTRAEQVGLAAENPANPYLQNRGYPGTHDIALGRRVLHSLRAHRGSVAVPVYEKSLAQGRGDRLPEAEWKRVALPLDFVFLEGWLLGYRAVEEQTIRDPALLEINKRLLAYQSWWSQLDALVQLKPRDYRYVVDWRIEAEENMKAAGKPGLSEAETRAYVTSFLPAYALYLPTVELNPGPRLVIEIERNRLPK